MSTPLRSGLLQGFKIPGILKTMERKGAWLTSRACRIWGGILIVATVLLGIYYDLITILTADFIFKGQNFMLNEMSSTLLIDEVAGFDETLVRAISLEEAYFERMRTLDVSQSSDKLTVQEMRRFKTRFLPNKNYMNFPLLTMENVCMDPTGALVLINTTQDEIQSNISGPAFIPELYYLWNDIYTCNGNVSNDNCAGVTFASRYVCLLWGCFIQCHSMHIRKCGEE